MKIVSGVVVLWKRMRAGKRRKGGGKEQDEEDEGLSTILSEPRRAQSVTLQYGTYRTSMLGGLAKLMLACQERNDLATLKA